MSSKTDLRAYFERRSTRSDGPAKKKNPNPEIIASPTEHVSRAEIEMDEVEKSTSCQSYNNIPKHIPMEVGKYALAHSTKDALAKFSKQYAKYTFKRTSINSWKASFKNNGNSQNLKKIGRRNLFSEELLKKFSFQRKISNVILDHDVPSALVLNLDQTPLSYVFPGKYTFSSKGSKSVPIKGLDDKRQITATFVVSATGFFLLIPLIYQSTS